MELWKGLVPTDSLDTVAERLARVARRATRQGFPVPSMRLGERKQRPVYGEGNLSIEQYIEEVEVIIEADDYLRLGKYTFLGTVASLADGSPFVTWVPGVERVDYTPTAVNHCDHCNTVRMRRDTYLVGMGAAVYQVGSSCIKDFTGHSPAAIVGWLKAVDDLSFSDDEVAGWGMHATTYYPPTVIIRFAARIASREGYISRQKAEDEDRTSTGEAVRAMLSANPVRRDYFDKEYPETEASDRLAEATMAAIERAEPRSEWESDVVRLASSKGVQWRHVGILTSAVILGLRKQERDAQAKVEGESTFLGEKGERLTLPVKVTLKREYVGDFGPSYIIRMANGTNDLLWFATSTQATDAITEGDEFTLVGTVKNHEYDKRTDRPTTVLTRCKVA